MTDSTHSAGASAPPGSSTAPGISRGKIVLAILLLGLVIGALHFVDLNWEEVPVMLERINRPLALLVMATLPVFGFPVSAVYLAAGAIFGPFQGLLVVTIATAAHLLFTQVLARTLLRGVVTRMRQRWAHRLPEIPPRENGTLVAMLVLVPGLPYVVRNCLLALAQVPWRMLFGVALPLYVIRSTTTIFLGNLGGDPSWPALYTLGAIYALKLVISALLFRRLRRRCRQQAVAATPAAPRLSLGEMRVAEPAEVQWRNR